MICKLEKDEWRWAEQVFGACSLGDDRNNRRVVLVAAQLARHPERSFNAAFEGYSDQRLAAYRFVENDEIEVKNIVAGGVKHVSVCLFTGEFTRSLPEFTTGTNN